MGSAERVESCTAVTGPLTEPGIVNHHTLPGTSHCCSCADEVSLKTDNLGVVQAARHGNRLTHMVWRPRQKTAAALTQRLGASTGLSLTAKTTTKAPSCCGHLGSEDEEMENEG